MIDKAVLLAIVMPVAVTVWRISFGRTERAGAARRRILKARCDLARREPERADAIRRWYEQSGSY